MKTTDNDLAVINRLHEQISKLEKENVTLKSDLEYVTENYEYILNDDWNTNSDIARRIVVEQFTEFLANQRIEESKEIKKVNNINAALELQIRNLREQIGTIVNQKDIERQAEVSRLNLQFTENLNKLRKDYEYKVQREKIRWDDLGAANATFIKNRKKQDAKFEAANKMISVIRDLFITSSPHDPNDHEAYREARKLLENAINDDSEANYDTSIDKRVNALEKIVENLHPLFSAINEMQNNKKSDETLLRLFESYAKVVEVYSEYQLKFG